jgi:hypothetical protein
LHRFGIGRPSGPALLSCIAAAALLLWPAGALGEDVPPAFTSPPAIEGDMVVGATVKAVATWTGVPAPIAKYAWSRCPATGGSCSAIMDAVAAQYVVTATDVGFRLRVRITLKVKGLDAINMVSVTTAVVVAAPTPVPVPTPVPSPTPSPNPNPTPDPTPEPVTPQARASFTEPVAPIVAVTGRATWLRPFPVVRIRGYFKRGGVRVTLLSVAGPRSAHITARCIGRGCPVRTMSLAKAPARLRPFERFLPAGTVLQVRVVRDGSVGKYVRFLIRARSAPLRTDLCLMPGRTQPRACPAP